MKSIKTLIPFIVFCVAAAGCTFILPFPDDLEYEDGYDDPEEDADGDMSDAEEDDGGGPGTCGDGVKDEGENCDDGANGNQHDGCTDACDFSCHGDDDCRLTENCMLGGTCNIETHVCEGSTMLDDGYVCGTVPERRICLDGQCNDSVCGDGFVDTGGGEFCEPEFDENCTDDCQFECESHDQCPDDGNPCNGQEYCDMDAGRCTSSDPPGEGTQCSEGTEPRKICREGSCLESTCGDGYVDYGAHPVEECDDGNPVDDDGCDSDCTYSCRVGTQDVDCDDRLGCTIDTCNADSHTCDNHLQTEGSVCAPGAGDCDLEDFCDGISPVCLDRFKSNDQECRRADDDCDVTEYCTGSSAQCPADAVREDGFECRAPAGGCDRLETCDGISKYCPVDVTWPDTYVCNEAEGYCDIEEKCPGGEEMYYCPEDVFKGAGEECDDTIECTGPDQCDGAGNCVGEPVYYLFDVADISLGREHACVLLDHGGIKCWGGNSGGQLGDGTNTNRAFPAYVETLYTGATEVVLGGFHTCAIVDSDGDTIAGMKCWGQGTYGKLGNGSSSDQSSPVDVSGLTSGVVAMAAGDNHTCAILTGGALKCWGYNAVGQLGDGSNTNSDTPVDVSGLGSSVIAVSAGSGHTCAIVDGDGDTIGGVECWGLNGSGQLGDGTGDNSLVPVNVDGLTDGVIAISLRYAHSCALLSTGAMKCWGFNPNGQLGDGTRLTRLTPTQVSGLDSNVEEIAAGWNQTCAIVGTGLKCWGDNYLGQLGDGTSMRALSPIDVFELDTGVAHVSTGGQFTCAVSGTHEAWCWGDDRVGEKGDRTTSIFTQPYALTELGTGANHVSAGTAHTCAGYDGSAVCWGGNDYGQLGSDSMMASQSPVTVSGLSGNVTMTASGRNHTCGMENGGVKCWGNNAEGQLGDGTYEERHTPVQVTGLTSGVQSITAGAWHTCALLSTGAMKCWGENENGQLGDSSNSVRTTPQDVTGMTTGVHAIGAGYEHTCAVLDTGAAKCWGKNEFGQLGDGSTGNSNAPVQVSGLPEGVNAVSLGGNHSCALISEGGVKCWGSNAFGQLGDGTTDDKHAPDSWVTDMDSGATAITSGYHHTCALLFGAMKCWGENGVGQLGIGTTTEMETTPVDVTGMGSVVIGMSGGENHTCALLGGGYIKCWGWDSYGQVAVLFPGYPYPVTCN